MQSQVIPPKLSRSNLNLVSENFQNIYSAVHDEKNQNIQLVPSLWGHHIYQSQVGWRGRLLNIIYGAIGLVKGDSFKNQKLAAAMQTTQKIYQELDQAHACHDVCFKEYLKKLCDDRPYAVKEDEVEISRTEIKEFYKSTQPLTKLIKKIKEGKVENKKLTDLFKSCFTSDLEQGVIDTPFYNVESYQQLKKNIDIMKLEGINGSPLPLSILRKASTWTFKEKPGEDNLDRILLKSWCKKLDAKKFKVRNLDRGLSAIVNHINTFNQAGTSLKADLVNLELALIDEEFNGFDRIDSKHIKWRDELAKGNKKISSELEKDIFNVLKTKVVFGEQINKRTLSEDKNIVFELKNEKGDINPDYVIVIGQNRAKLPLVQRARAERGWGIRTAEFHYVDPRGRFAIVEKLSQPLNSTSWKSTGTLLESDKNLATPIQQMLQWFLKQNNTPKNLNKDCLMFNRHRELKATKGCLKGEYDAMALETMAYECSNNNLAVYKFLIEPFFKVEKNLAAKEFFLLVIKNAMQKEPIEVSRVGSLMASPITDGVIIERGKALSDAVQKLKMACSKSIENKYEILNVDKFNEIMSKAIIDFYLASKGFGRLWESLTSDELEKNVISQAKSLLKLKK